MLEQRIEEITEKANQELDLLREYMKYYITFRVERELNFQHSIPVMQSAIRGFQEACIMITGNLGYVDTNIPDRKPLEFSSLKNNGLGFSGIVLSLRASIKNLNQQIEEHLQLYKPKFISDQRKMIENSYSEMGMMLRDVKPIVFSNFVY